MKILDIRKDTYGQEILAFFQGEKSYEVVERDDRLIDISGKPSVYFAEFKDWPKIQKQAIKFTRGKVLDVGAGAGRFRFIFRNRALMSRP